MIKDIATLRSLPDCWGGDFGHWSEDSGQEQCRWLWQLSQCPQAALRGHTGDAQHTALPWSPLLSKAGTGMALDGSQLRVCSPA